MRFARHLLLGLLALALLGVAAIAFALYDPFSSGRRWLEDDQLITAPAALPAGRATNAEPPIALSDPPWLSTLALRYQPALIVSGYDRFWPTAMPDILASRWKGRGPCLFIDGRCAIRDPTVGAFATPGSRRDYLRLPAPLDNVQDTFLATASELGILPAALHRWPRSIASLDPFPTAQMYFYELPRTDRRSYPGAPGGLISLEYWFLYPLNYFPLVRIPLQALSSPIGSTIGNTDYHQGDLEHVAVLIDPRTRQPRYLWMARHADEGALYRWGSRQVQWRGTHPTVYAALGSHASYARCGIQRRTRTYLFINDYVVCIPHRTYGFLPASTPLVDLTHTIWACWRGHLGDDGRDLLAGQVGFAPYETGGPTSPLLQQENFRTACHLSPSATKPAPAL